MKPIVGLLAPNFVICLIACSTLSTPIPTSTPLPIETSTPATKTSTPADTPTPWPTPTMTSPPGITPQQTEPKETVEIAIRRQGLAISKSDVSDMPDSVLTVGEVLFVPEEHAADLAETAGFDPSDIDGMRHAFFQLDESRLAKLDGAAAVIGADGLFPLDIPDGHYFVCLADSFVDHTAGPPYSVVGCDVIDLANDASLTVSFGEAGVEATLD